MTMFEPKRQYGIITPDTYIPGRDPGSLSLYFYRTYLHSAKDSGIKKGDKVTYIYQSSRMMNGYISHEAKDIRVIDNDNYDMTHESGNEINDSNTTWRA